MSKWLEDYADVFGIQIGQNQTANVDPADIAAYKKMTGTADTALTPERGADVMTRLMNANSKEELDEIIAQSGL